MTHGWKTHIRRLTATASALVSCAGSALAEAPGPDTILWYTAPATMWNEALPVGNGRLGAMIFGGFASERLQLNEDSLWSGAPQAADNTNALVALPKIRELLFAGKYEEAEALANRNMICRGPGSNRGRGAKAAYGCYQTLGDLNLAFDHGQSAEPLNYRRELDLASAISRVAYEVNGVKFEREMFSSAPDQVLVARFTTSRPGALTFTANLARSEAADVAHEGNQKLLMRGQLWNGEAWEGMRYAARLCVVNEGGSLSASTNGIRVTGADAATLYLVAATDYRMQLPEWRTGNPEQRTAEQLDAALKKPFNRMRADHIGDYQRLFGRLKLDLGGLSDATRLPTNQRLEAIKRGGADLALISLYFNFGRYLLISCSRPGDMPANLQGLWADGLQTPWNCDYHANINLQMIYWPAETANLAECFEPLNRYIAFLTEPGARTAKTHYNARGWTVHTIANPWGFTAPGESPSWGLSPSAGAWLSQHLWEHYAFGADTNYLRRVLPILRASAQFSLDWLVPDPRTGLLVAGPATSPENKFITADGQKGSLCMGPTMEQELVYDAFQNYLDAVKVLGVVEPTVKEVSEAQSRLLLPRIGSDGRLMEWPEEFKEAEPGHRHVSHLFALHPGRQITRRETPDLAKATAKTLEARLAAGGGHTGWSRAWMICFWARLGEGQKVAENIEALLAKSTLPNLFDTHPPFQIDGNFGAVAGVCEALLQSHAGEIELLPALPPNWQNGSIRGLRARGACEVDIVWREGRFHSASLRGSPGTEWKVRLGEKRATVKLDRRGRSEVRFQ